MIYSEDEKAFLTAHRWAVLATTRKDGTPQQAMVGYTLDAEGRVLISTTRPSAKWRNIVRTPSVSLTVPTDGCTRSSTAERKRSTPTRNELNYRPTCWRWCVDRTDLIPPLVSAG